MGEDEKTPEERRMECLGGWGFLMLGFGLITLIPGAILTATYGVDSSNKSAQIAVATTFAIGVAILFTGLLLAIVWCRLSNYKQGGKKADEKDSGSNGQSTTNTTNTGLRPSAHAHDSTKSSPATMYSVAPSDGDDVTRRSDDSESQENLDRFRYQNKSLDG